MSRDDEKADNCSYIAMSSICRAADLTVESLKDTDPDALSQSELDLCINGGLDRIERDGVTAHSVLCMATACLIWLKADYMKMPDQKIEELLEEIDEAEALAEMDTDLSEEPTNNGSMLN
jgi:hypothetical protein